MLRSKIYLISIFLLLNIYTLTNCENIILKGINYNCTRECDSHFSNEECWRKTFKFFTSEMIESVVEYYNVVLNSKANRTNSDIIARLNKTIGDQSADEDKAKIDSIETFILDVYNKMASTNTQVPAKNNYYVKCPTKCEPSKLNIIITFFGVFVGLTVVTIGFIMAYTLGLKLKYREVDKSIKEKTNGLNQ